MFRPIKLLLILSIATGALAENVEECSNKCQETIVEKYFTKLSEIYKEGSKTSHIEALFSSLSNEVKYEHLVYGANFNRSEWKEAFLRNHKSGAYKSEPNEEIRVENYIHGKGYVAVAYSYGVKEKNGTWVPKGEQSLMALFSLENGQIKSVKEYW